MIEKIKKFFIEAWAFIRKNLGLIVAVFIIVVTTVTYKVFGVAITALNTEILLEYDLLLGGLIIFSYTITLATFVVRLFYSKNSKLLSLLKRFLSKDVSLEKKEKHKKISIELLIIIGLFISLPAFFFIYVKQVGYELKSHTLNLLFFFSSIFSTILAICTALFFKDYPIFFVFLFLIFALFIIRKKILEKVKKEPT